MCSVFDTLLHYGVTQTASNAGQPGEHYSENDTQGRSGKRHHVRQLGRGGASWPLQGVASQRTAA
jgi:hypothetical protein